MSQKRIQFNNIIKNQLPEYVREEFPLVSEFLKQYYISQEFEGSSADLIQNIDQYIKLDNIKSNSESAELSQDVSFLDDEIFVSSTLGFPSSYGLLQIDNEIITYTGKTSNSFTGCIRGFSGVKSYNTESSQDELLFETTNSEDHYEYIDNDASSGDKTKVINLSSLFLKEFFNKIKNQITPGFENREFYSGLDKYLFLKQSKDFYSTRGADLSFKILFNVLYGEEVKVIKPQDYLIKPSNALYEITNDLVVETISGNPYELERSTLKQDAYDDASVGIVTGFSPISRVEKILSDQGKEYYKLSFDAGYNRDINVEGSLYGNFSIHPKTKLIGNVSVGTTTLDVDSTLGFPSSGELLVSYSDSGLDGIISYTSKNLNQFFGCQNITGEIEDSSDICLNVYAYGESNTGSGETIRVRVTSVLNKITNTDNPYYYNSGDTGIIKTLGINPTDAVSNNWFSNISNIIENVSVKSLGNNNFDLTTTVEHNLKIGDKIEIVSTDGVKEFSTVEAVNSEKTITVRGNLSTNRIYSIQRTLLKVNSANYSHLSNEIANVQNVYKDGNKILVSSPSLPYYKNTPLQPSDRSKSFDVNVGVGVTFNIQNHKFYTGESVYYTPGSVELFEEGIYFVKKLDDNNIKLSKSRENIFKAEIDPDYEGYVSAENTSTSTNNKLEPYEFYSKKLSSQKLLREILQPTVDGNEYETKIGTTGILINGIEILNYKSKDKIYYGEVESIDIIKPGSEYDIINPPSLIITDSVGTGATGYCSVKGSLKEIRIIDPGFDYIEIPKINITGGNGEGAKATASMKLIDHQVFFNSESKSALVNLSNSTIGFSTYHKFRKAEKVLYKTDSQQSVGGLTNNSLYYVSTPDFYTVKLHKSYDDALTGINTVSLTSYGVGNHILESYNKKSVMSSIIIEDSGDNYENKKRTVTSSGISTSLGYINIINHGFNSGEIVKYSNIGTVISGLTNNTNYYLTKVDEDNFKLSLVGVGSDNQDFYYKTNQYLQLKSTGSGNHTFNYPEIVVDIVGNIGIGSTTDNSFKAMVQPIFRGEISSIYISNNGVGYGSSEIINFNRTPQVSLNSGSEAKLSPVINNGKIEQVLIINPGKDYNSPPNLNVITNGTGVGAVLTPVIENGQIKSIKIIESGGGYDPNNTFITVSASGSAAELSIRLKSWTINLFQKYFKNISNDDGFIFYNPKSNYGLQYAHLYAPRKLRENIYSKDGNGNNLYGKFDLRKNSRNEEISSTDHSPIIGWAYDGNPIYGPYGYSKKNGVDASIVRMKSGYARITTASNRPPFESGFFVEDYVYRNVDDDTVLDEYNGRFCVTPEFPNGTYAYFATIDGTFNNSFGKYRLPIFPYFIGNKYKSVPNEFNFKKTSNQDDYDLNSTNWSRNTNPYNLLKNNSIYPYLNLPNSLDQTIDVQYSSPGSINNISIIAGGSNYKVNDKVVFDDEGTSGFGFASKVSRVQGKSIDSVSIATTTIYNVEIYPSEGNKNFLIVQSSDPHGLSNLDIVSITGLNTTTSLLDRSYPIGVNTTNTFAISNSSGIGNVAATGNVTYISVTGSIAYLNARENDIYRVGSEKVKILNIDRRSSRLRILREIDGTVGVAHSYSDILYEVPRRFSINVGNTTSYAYNINREIYFNPEESIGIGTLSTVGAGKTITFSNPGVGITQIFISTKTIYIPNHNLQTGDELTYSTNSGSPIVVSSNGSNTITLEDQSKVYVARIDNDLIGISTVRVGLGSTGTFVGIASTTRSMSTLYFKEFGTGTYHSFKTNYQKLTGQVSKNIVTVSTAQSHGLKNNDVVFVDINPGLTTTVTIKYNDYNRKVLVNSRSFISSDVNITTNSITIENHNFENGQKVLYTSSSPSSGLVNNNFYYVVVFDKNTLKLSSSYYESTLLSPKIVDINSSSSGTLSPINPPIKVYRDSTVIFDLTDSSLSYVRSSKRYPAFELNFYKDSNYTQIFDRSDKSEGIEVVRTGIGSVGISSNAKVSLKINNNTPQKLYYKLDAVYSESLPSVKSEVNVDSSVISNNEVQVLFSGYNGEHKIVSTSSSTFTYNLTKIPESLYYDNSSGLHYNTNSLNAIGPVAKIDILSKGQNYNHLPRFLQITSGLGTGAIIESFDNSIGKIRRTKINDIGFDFSCDKTVRPSLIWPQLLKIDPLTSIDYIGISSNGKGYSTAPKLIVLDGKTNEFLSEIDLKYSLGDTYVTILNNTYRLNNVTPIIIPIQNSNGVGISSIQFDSSTKDVTITLVGFSTVDTFPFNVNDKVLVENISVGGVSTTGKGFNSEDYDYQLFTLTAVDKNVGGIGTVSYNLGEYLKDGEFPGTFDEINSAGRLIPQNHFPLFDVKLKPNEFSRNESVGYANSTLSIGYAQDWDYKSKILKVSSRKILNEGDVIEGLSSKTRGRILSNTKFEGFVDIGAYSKVEKGWVDETGILNNNFQRIQDNFYYQNFSYSLRSRVPYDTWEDAVGSLNHTAGFKKFSDYQLESFAYSGISTDITSRIDTSVDLDGFASLNCVYDFDLASENALLIKSKFISDEINFSSRVISDYFESVGNRVLSIDDISDQFNNNERSNRCSVVHRFPLLDARSQKYITYVKDRRFVNERQILILSLIHNNNVGYLNQYGRVETVKDLGSFDFLVDNQEGLILFCPIKYRVNDYDVTTLSYNLKDNFVGVGSTSLGNVAFINTNTSFAPTGSSRNIISLDSKYTSLKVLVEIEANNGTYEFDELNLVHSGHNSPIELLEYGQLTTHSEDSFSYSGLGTYRAYFTGNVFTSKLNIDFIPNPGIAATINSLQIAISNKDTSGIGTFDIKNARFQANTTSIIPLSIPTSNVIAEYPNDYQGGYFIVQIIDVTNNRYQLSEVIVVNDDDEAYMTEFGNVETHTSLGTIGASKNSNTTTITFTPIPFIQTQVKVFFNALNSYDVTNSFTEYNNKTAVSDYAISYGTIKDVKREFELKHQGTPIFQKYFDASNSSIVSVGSSTIKIPNHFFVTGEQITYSSGEITAFSNPNPISIASTDFGVGIGITDKLPSSVYVIKIDNDTIKLARNASDALAFKPKPLDITAVGIGTSHIFTAKKQNVRTLSLIDNIIQSPIVSTSTTTYLSKNLRTIDDILYADSTNNLLIGDLILINDEIMKIEAVGIGSTNSISVVRSWLGTDLENHNIGTSITKVEGNYNIIDNKIHFVEAPYGNVPKGISSNPPDERDWDYTSTRSSFQGRVFMRSGITDESNDAYYKNYAFDNISSQFDGSTSTFTLKSNKSSIVDIFDDNGIILINNIFQYPGIKNNYIFDQPYEDTLISFVGSATSLPSDINTSGLPSGGIIVSVGSTEGFGYQPLISAGGTAIVSAAGTISSISIGNSGSGYRSSIQTLSGIATVTVRVGVVTSSVETPDINYVGIASVSGGNIVSIAITNPGIGYTSTNPPRVIIDAPISYSDIPLIYSNSSSGIGTRAIIDIVVSQDSSVVDFEIKNTGYGYEVGDILTLPVGGFTGIPTNPNLTLKEFQISVQSVDRDKFSGWSMGEFEILDDLQKFFNGERKVFSLYYNGSIFSVYARKGSQINVQDILLVFVNDVLQVPGEGYIFKGGSKITFTEALKPDDKCRILFYKGSGDNVDVIFNDIIETVKVGDDLQITYDSYVGQSPSLLEDERKVTDIISINSTETNPYFGPGNVSDETLERPINWCRQTEDLTINGKDITKDRVLYEPLIYPTTHIIQPVGVGSTIIYVENLRPFFNPINENASSDIQNFITIISQDTKVPGIATAIVSEDGTISSIVIEDGGFGYKNAPSITIQNPIGISSIRETAIASITSGIITSISVTGVITGYSSENPPVILIDPPSVDKETDRVISYSGDSGIVVGVGTTVLGSYVNLILDLYIPKDSSMRNSSLVGTAVTISQLSQGDFFVVSNSNVGLETTFYSIGIGLPGPVIGIPNQFLDTVYQVNSAETRTSNIVGVGITYIRRIFANVVGLGTITFSSNQIKFDSDVYTFDNVGVGSTVYSGGITTSNYFGNYSWGKIRLRARSKDTEYNYYGTNGTVGIETSALIRRTNPLKYTAYT